MECAGKMLYAERGKAGRRGTILQGRGRKEAIAIDWAEGRVFPTGIGGREHLRGVGNGHLYLIRHLFARSFALASTSRSRSAHFSYVLLSTYRTTPAHLPGPLMSHQSSSLHSRPSYIRFSEPSFPVRWPMNGVTLRAPASPC